MRRAGGKEHNIGVSLSADDLSSLHKAIAGEALLPEEPGWDAARQPWNLLAEQRPAMVGIPASADDVAAMVGFAGARGLRVAPQGIGHGSTSLRNLDGAMLLRTTRLSGVEIDAGARRARAGAGCPWSDVVAAAAPHGLVGLHGSSGTVGVVGYTLTGGLGWLGRSRGFACNSVTALEVVTAAGDRAKLTAESDPELFWALRGGGGGSAIVTDIEFELFELREVYAGSLMWPIELAGEIAQAWREWTKAVPEELTSNLKLSRFPPFPEVPEPLRGRALVAATFAHCGTAEEGSRIVDALRQVADPYLDTARTIAAPELADLAGDPPGPLAGRGAGVLVTELDAEAIDAYVELAGPGADVPLVHLEIRHLGGALDRAEQGSGALARAGGAYLLYGVGAVTTPESDAAIAATLDAVQERMRPWTAPQTLLGFAEQQQGLAASFPPEAADRLARVKADRDPEGLILGNHVDGS